MLGPVLPTILQPTGAPGGIDGLHAEASRLQRFADIGVRVPEVLEKTDDFITLADCGPQLRAVVREETDRGSRSRMLERAMRTLASLHDMGLAHGRPCLRDMTLWRTVEAPDGVIYLLDLEEDPVAVMSVEDAQARDVWLLLASCVEFCADPEGDLHDLLAVYRKERAADPGVALRAMGRGLRPVRRIVGAVWATDMSNDVRGTYWATRTLERL